MAKRPVGRPKIKNPVPKKTVILRPVEADKKLWQEAAARDGRSLGNWAERVLSGAAKNFLGKSEK